MARVSTQGSILSTLPSLHPFSYWVCCSIAVRDTDTNGTCLFLMQPTSLTVLTCPRTGLRIPNSGLSWTGIANFILMRWLDTFPVLLQHFQHTQSCVMFSQPHTETSACLAKRSVERVLSQLAQQISHTAVDLTSVESFCWTKSLLISALGLSAVLMPVAFIFSHGTFFFRTFDSLTLSCNLWQYN